MSPPDQVFQFPVELRRKAVKLQLLQQTLGRAPLLPRQSDNVVALPRERSARAALEAHGSPAVPAAPMAVKRTIPSRDKPDTPLDAG